MSSTLHLCCVEDFNWCVTINDCGTTLVGTEVDPDDTFSVCCCFFFSFFFINFPNDSKQSKTCRGYHNAWERGHAGCRHRQESAPSSMRGRSVGVKMRLADWADCGVRREQDVEAIKRQASPSLVSLQVVGCGSCDVVALDLSRSHSMPRGPCLTYPPAFTIPLIELQIPPPASSDTNELIF